MRLLSWSVSCPVNRIILPHPIEQHTLCTFDRALAGSVLRLSIRMFILNRPARAVGAGIGIVKEYNADRKSSKAKENDPKNNNHDGDQESSDDDAYEWAQAIDGTQTEVSPQAQTTIEDQSGDLTWFFKRQPPPPYDQQQPRGKLPLPVILPQRRPHQRVRGWVRGYAPLLADVGVDQEAWFDFLDQFEKSINQNQLFWVSNAAVWIADKAYVVGALSLRAPSLGCCKWLR